MLVAVGYIVAFTLLSFGLERGLNLGIAYGIWAAAGVAAVAILSANTPAITSTSPPICSPLSDSPKIGQHGGRPQPRAARRGGRAAPRREGRELRAVPLATEAACAQVRVGEPVVLEVRLLSGRALLGRGAGRVAVRHLRGGFQ